MAARSILITIIVALAASRPGLAQTYPLSEISRAGDCFRIHLDMTLSGEMRVNKEGKSVSLKLEATALHEFSERVLTVASDGSLEKAARIYDNAKAVIRVNQTPSERTLHPERRLRLLGARCEGGHLGRLHVVEPDIGHQVLDDGEGPHRGDGDGLVLVEVRQAGHAHEPGPAVDLGRARPALAGLAVPAARQVA